MRLVAAISLVAAAGAAGALASLWGLPVASACSVFDRHPCAPIVGPTVCSVFHRGPCPPDILPPVGQDLRLTIETPTAAPAPEPLPGAPAPGEVATTAQAQHENEGAAQAQHKDGSEQRPVKIDTIRELFNRLRACWAPPPLDEARAGMQMSVRFSFKRDGEIIGKPRMTFVTPDSSSKDRDIYRRAIDASLERCTPIPFTNGMGGAIAGRPIAIRFVDNRSRS